MFTINLIVDGTPETAFAFQVALKLASAFGNRLVAHAFVEGDNVLQTVGFSGPGLCGSGVFMEAYEKIVSDLVALYESLMESLRARTEGSNISFEQRISVRHSCGCCNPCLCPIMETVTPEALFVLAGHRTNVELAKAIFEKVRCPVLITQSYLGEPELLLMSDNLTSNLSELSKALGCAPADIRHIAEQSKFTGDVYSVDIRK